MVPMEGGNSLHPPWFTTNGLPERLFEFATANLDLRSPQLASDLPFRRVTRGWRSAERHLRMAQDRGCVAAAGRSPDLFLS